VSALGTGSGPLIHHELCFGCGRQNLFGLLSELDPTEDGAVAGRCFIKQDHQGPEPGSAHPGLIAAALIEALAFAAGHTPFDVEVRFDSFVPVGDFLELVASEHQASAIVSGRTVATARASYG
jgi:hypothetical protein